MGMMGIQIYITEEMSKLLRESYGEGKISANIERVMMAHLSNPDREAQLRMNEIKKACKLFNHEFPEWELKLVIGVVDKEKAPAPPKEKAGP